MKLKVSRLMSNLHDNNELKEEDVKFLARIGNYLNETFYEAPLDDYNCDLKFIFIESGGSEGKFLNEIKNLKEPYYLLTTGKNNSLAASMEILTYLNEQNLKGEILHGSEKYIAKRISELYAINNVVTKLPHLRLGVVGKPSDWLIASIPNFDELHKKLGVKLNEIDIETLADYYEEAKESEFTENVQLDFDKKSLESAKRMHVAINRIKNDYKLNGLTIRCFDLLSSCKTTSCLSFSLLNREDFIATCEGDVMAMISMCILKLLLNQPTFQANPSRIDLETNEILFAHCTVPLNMAKEYTLDTHFESGIGVGIKGELNEDDVTVFRMSKDLKHYFVAEGKIERNLHERNLCRTQIMLKMKDDISSLFRTPCGNHHIIVYGHHKELINNLMRLLNFTKC